MVDNPNKKMGDAGCTIMHVPRGPRSASVHARVGRVACSRELALHYSYVFEQSARRSIVDDVT